MRLRIITLFGIVASMVTGIALGILMFLLWPAGVGGVDSARAYSIQRAAQFIASNYVEAIPDGQLLDDALKGMLNGLDDHSKFLDAKAYQRLQVDTEGTFGGIGIELGLVAGYFAVAATLADTPAAAALREGDRLIAVDDVPLKGKQLMEVVELLRGPSGTEVRVSLVRSGNRVDVDLMRANIAMRSVSARWLEPGFAYVRIARFQNRTGREFAQALAELNEDGAAAIGGGRPRPVSGDPSEIEPDDRGDAPVRGAVAIRGLVLDLRDNPGGVLGASVDVADTLLDRGLLICTEGRPNAERLEHRARAGDLLRGAPLAVLINRGSASGSEIVASALQDHGRAILVGDQSYGKGSVQSVLALGDRALKLTTGYYYRPGGLSIQAGGVLPDMRIDSADNADWLERALSVVKAEVLVAR